MKKDGWLQLPVQSHVVFDHPPLTLAICQIRYPAMFNVSNPGIVATFQNAIQDEFPIGTPMAQLGMTLNLQGGPAAGIQSQGASALWRFSDVNDDWTVVLSSEFVSLETRAYIDFEDFLARLRRVLEALVNTVRPKVYTRVGLRYINELHPGHQNWEQVVRTEMLGPMVVPTLAEHAAQWTQQIVLRGSEGEKLNINHGVLPQGTTVEPRPGDESTAQEPFYLLDLDAYREFVRPGWPEVSFNTISNQVRSAHETVSRFFRWAITESYATTLGVRNEDSN